ncbi:MAG: hypothetical protein A2Y21_06400, partial [Clostridiales bacterium GWC2_40_7]
WIGGTPALMALSREYNKDYSLDLKIAFIHNDIERIKALNEGKIHATEISLPSYVKQLEKYPESGVIIGITDFSRGADGIVAKSVVKDLNDMEDRKVSFVKDGTGKFILNKFLRLTGLRYQDIIPIERDNMGDVINDLKSGNADLAVSWSPDMNLAVRDINKSTPNSVKMLITTKEVPNLIPTVLVVSKKMLEKDPESVKAFIKTWYASAKYILEKPDKAHQKLVELMNEKADEYGEVALEDVKDSLANIKLMAINDNYSYFGIGGGEKTLDSIIRDTVQTWKKYGDINEELNVDGIYDGETLNYLHDENDEELIVDYKEIQGDGTASVAETDKVFEKQDEKSIETNTEKVAKIDIPPVYYDSGKAAVKADSLPVLDQVVDISKQFPEYYILIDAHTDSVGSEEANLKLSRDRADEVKKYLFSKGVNVDRIVARGWGEYRPVVSVEKNEEDKAANRRTEFILTRDITDQ